MLALLVDCCASVLQRSARIEKLVFIDPLTGSFNRSYFDRQVMNEMARAQRDASSFALCLADIDDFKQYNTHYGYEAGNQVLEHVAQTLRNAVRPFDTVARWGGEEFAVLLTAPVSPQDVITICERLRTLIEKQIVPVESLDRQVHRTSVTVSIGVALYPDDEKTPQDLFRAANYALLQAKAGPKNRVVYYRPPTEWRANSG
jgi:diguanylate cyclase (GGDEF)-like protein